MCESEENSRLSSSDDPLTVGSSVASEPDCFVRRFGGATRKSSFQCSYHGYIGNHAKSHGGKDLDQTEDVCPKIGEENVSFNVNARSLTKPGLKRVRRFCNPDIISSFTYSTKLLSLALLFNILH